MDKLLLTVGEAQEALGLGRTTIYQLVASGQLGSVHIGRSVRIPVSALITFAESLEMKVDEI
jgi:excisionase family DNA binding protein